MTRNQSCASLVFVLPFCHPSLKRPLLPSSTSPFLHSLPSGKLLIYIHMLQITLSIKSTRQLLHALRKISNILLLIQIWPNARWAKGGESEFLGQMLISFCHSSHAPEVPRGGSSQGQRLSCDLALTQPQSCMWPAWSTDRPCAASRMGFSCTMFCRRDSAEKAESFVEVIARLDDIFLWSAFAVCCLKSLSQNSFFHLEWRHVDNLASM